MPIRLRMALLLSVIAVVFLPAAVYATSIVYNEDPPGDDETLKLLDPETVKGLSFEGPCSKLDRVMRAGDVPGVERVLHDSSISIVRPEGLAIEGYSCQSAGHVGGLQITSLGLNAVMGDRNYVTIHYTNPERTKLLHEELAQANADAVTVGLDPPGEPLIVDDGVILVTAEVLSPEVAANLLTQDLDTSESARILVELIKLIDRARSSERGSSTVLEIDSNGKLVEVSS